MSELTYGAVFNDFYDGTDAATRKIGVGSAIPTDMDMPWDAKRARACVCDGGWSGINCAARMCPYGNDAMDSRANGAVAVVQQSQRIRLFVGGDDHDAVNDEFLPGTTTAGTGEDTTTKMDQSTPYGHGAFDVDLMELGAASFSLTFTSKMNERFTTRPIVLTATWDVSNELNLAVATALKELPNWVIDDVTVVSQPSYLILGAALDITVTFTGEANHGNQNLLEINVAKCSDGCFPKLLGIQTLVSPLTTTNGTSYVAQSVSADFNSYECGRRGKCDYDVGLCSCFEGFTGDSCSSITALV
jgi:hypothetical protein